MNVNVPAIASSTYATTTVNPDDWMKYAQAKGQVFGIAGANNLAIVQAQKGNQMPARRLVQVIIVDPNENVPLDGCMLFKGDEKLTDATDQELFFELDIKEILEKHNKKRIKIIDKKVKDRTEYLEPAKIRDLKMVVVNVASF